MTNELRKDYILDRWVIVAPSRNNRPKQFKEEHPDIDHKTCYFCSGNEELTPCEIGRLGKNKWDMRWFPNKFPAVDENGQIKIKTDNKYFTYSANYGKHEVIVESNDHKKQLSDLTIKQITDLLNIYNQRIIDIPKKNPHIKYVQIFKNHGEKGGTSIVHTHSQVIGLNHIPKQVRDEISAIKECKNCPYCEIVNIEKESDRRCFENDSFVAFTPYASRYNYEIWIFPKEHIKSLAEIKDLKSLAGILKQILNKLKEINCSYNYYIHYSPEGEDLHFHIEITPRISTFAGFEIGSGEIINSVSPEDAAKFYRGEI